MLKILLVSFALILGGCAKVSEETNRTTQNMTSEQTLPAEENLPIWETAYLKYLLTPQSRDKLKNSPLSNKTEITDYVVHLRWVPRTELKYRLEKLQAWQRDKSIAWSNTGSEDLEEFVYTDINVAEYDQQMTWDINTTSRENVWRYWIAPEQGKKLYALLTRKFPNSRFVTKKPEDDSICVILTYVDNGELYVNHFYIESRIGVQSMIGEIKFLGVDCKDWNMHDERFISPDWLSTELKYTNIFWGN